MPALVSTPTQENVFTVDNDGNLVTKYLPSGGAWGSYLIAAGCRPKSQPVARTGYEGDAARIDVYADAANGGVIHAWYPGDAWHTEAL